MGGGGALRCGVDVVARSGFGRVFLASVFGVRFCFSRASERDAIDLAGFSLLLVEDVLTSDKVLLTSSSAMIPTVNPSEDMF